MRCRSCLNTDSEEFIEMETIHLNGKSFYDYFNECTNLGANAGDGLPSSLCINCSRELEAAYNFVQGAREVDATLRTILSSTSSQVLRVKLTTTMGQTVDEDIQATTDHMELAYKDLDPLCFTDVIEEESCDFIEPAEIKLGESYTLKTRCDSNEKDITYPGLEGECETENKLYDENNFPHKNDIADENEFNDENDIPDENEFPDENDFSDEYDFPAENEFQDKPEDEDENEFKMKNRSSDGTGFQHENAIQKENEFPDESDTRNPKGNEFQYEKELDSCIGVTIRGGKTVLENFTCQFCYKVCFTKSDVMKHYIQEHASKVTCEKCPKYFNLPYELDLHNELVHGVDSPVTCIYCPNILPIPRDQLAQHFRRKHSHRFYKFFPNTRRNDEQFQCGICKRFCITAALYADHMQAHTNEKKFKCKFCPMDFQIKRSFQVHLKRKHNASGNVKAYQRENESILVQSGYGENISDWRINAEANTKSYELEDYSTMDQEGSENHVKIEYVVEECEVERECNDQEENENPFETKYANNKETQTIVKNYRKNPRFQCEICGCRCATAALLSYHMHSHSKKISYECSICLKCFNTNQNYQEHLKRKHSNYKTDEAPKIECKECHKEISAVVYDEHLEWHKQNKNKQFLCSFCPRLFNCQKLLTAHESKIHLNQKQETKLCTFCNKQIDISYYNVHVKKIHPSERKHICAVCGNSFKVRGQLELHMKLHKAREFECSICNKGFVRQFDLKIHLRTHTGELPYACHLCDKRFAMKGRLTYHLQRHAGIKHRCKVCGKEYNFLTLLRKHSYTHTGMPYRCTTCGYACALREVFTRHIQRLHGLVMTKEELSNMFKENTGRMPRIPPVEELRCITD